jgi:hypothetical protein
MKILEDLEMLIAQNEDDFDRGMGKFILRDFIKQKRENLDNAITNNLTN